LSAGLDPSRVERALAAWRVHDVARGIHPVDRQAVRATEAARALVLELFDRPARDLYNACAQLGRLLADAGASPSLAVSTIDGAAHALASVGVAPDGARVPSARASVAEGYFAAIRQAERDEARRAWDPPACLVPLDDTTVAIAAGHPADDGEGLAEWAAKVAAKVSKSGARAAVVAGPEAAKREIAEALRLVGVEARDALPPRKWLRLPWRK
jgi:hypothetical protein